MVFLLKTTLHIDDTAMRRLREEAARRDTTISALVEAALRQFLEPKAPKGRELPPFPLSKAVVATSTPPTVKPYTA
jgi:hypothetical protein